MNDSSSSPDVSLGDLADEYVSRLRRGEQPDVKEFIQLYPHLATDILDLFPAIAAVESCKGSVVEATLTNHELPLGLGPGKMVGEYRLLRQIGRGGMGIVYEAEQPSLGRRVAIKILPPKFATSPDRLARFQREVRAAAKLHHTNIVPVFGVGESGGLHFYTMQYINGEGLDHVLHQIQQLRHVDGESVLLRDLTHTWRAQATHPASSDHPERIVREDDPSHHFETAADRRQAAPPDEESGHDLSGSEIRARSGPHSNELSDRSGLAYYRSIARLGWQVADALAYAHGQGVLHRDIKPSNLLLDLQGTVWLTDFGLAKELASDDLTSTGELVGTLRFMAPERLRGRSLPEGDVYSLGLTLYELLTLTPVWDEREPGQLVTRIMNEVPTTPRWLDDRIPRDLETIVLKCIAKSPSDRYRRAADLAEDLQRYLSDRPILARRFGWGEQSWRWCRRNPLVATLSAAVVSLLLTIAILSSWTARQYRDKHLEAVQHLGRAERAETELRANNTALQATLAASLEAQAHALRVSGEQGCRLHALELLDRAATMTRSSSLRNEVVAALVKWDARGLRQVPILANAFHRPATFCADATLSRLAVLDAERQLHIFSLADGRERFHSDHFRLPTRPDPGSASSLSLLRDGRTAILGCQNHAGDHAVWLWDLADSSSSPQCVITGPIELPPAISADERRLAVAMTEGGIRIVDLRTGREERRIAATRRAARLAFHPDGNRLALSLRDRRHIEVWDVASDASTCEFTLPDQVLDLAWNHDGRLLAAACQDSLAYVLDIQLRRQLSVTKGHRLPVERVAFLQPGDWLAAWSPLGPTIVADPTLGETIQVIPGGLVGVRQDGSAWLVDDGHRIEEWQVALPLGRRLARHRFSLNTIPEAWMEGPRSIDFSPDGRLLATADLDGLRIFSLHPDLQELAWIRTYAPDWVKFDEASQNLFANPVRKGIRRWPLSSHKRDDGLHLQVGEPTNWGPTVEAERPASILSAQRKQLFLGWRPRSNVSSIVSGIFDLASGESTGFMKTDERYWPAAISPSGDAALTSTVIDGGKTHAWNLAKNEVVHSWPFWGYGMFSPDGKEIVLRKGGDRVLQVYRTDTWQMVRTIACRDPFFASFSVSSDGQYLAILDRQGIRIFHYPTATYLVELPTDHVGLEVIRPEFSPDGSLLATGRMGHIVHVWDLRALRAELKRRNLDWQLPDYPAAHEQLPFISATTPTTNLGASIDGPFEQD